MLAGAKYRGPYVELFLGFLDSSKSKTDESFQRDILDNLSVQAKDGSKHLTKSYRTGHKEHRLEHKKRLIPVGLVTLTVRHPESFLI